MYLSIPEYGFSSKIQSAKKKRKFVPNTPAKKNKSHAAREIYSPFANLLKFEEDQDNKMMVSTTQSKGNKFITDFEVIQKIGEGSFGEAFKVRSKIDGQFYAVKKAKEKYLGYRDRDQKLSEVHKSLKISTNKQDTIYASSCVKFYEAWEESGYLFIRSELCEKGNLNEYLVELEKL